MKTTSKTERIQETDRVFHLACDLFKRWYGDWPKRVGLAYNSRYRERRYADYYTVREPDINYLPVNYFSIDHTDISNSAYRMKQTEIRIDSAAIADDEVLCEWENTTVKMTFVFTEQGYHCICQEDCSS